jgi:hypothetical protein
MSSFKLAKSKGAKAEAISGGIMILAIAIPVYFLISVLASVVMGGIGLMLILGGLGATE